MKIFCIGFHKTGTKSIGAALAMLGYRVCGPVGVNNPDIAHRWPDVITPMLEQYDAFQDNPWPILFQSLDQYRPDSKFILTYRPEHLWWDSILAHFGTHTTPMREWIYGEGAPAGHEQIYRQRYREHNQAVLSYFKSRPQDLLALDITAGCEWRPLCQFLGVSEPKEPFPFINQRTRRLDFSQ